MFEQSFTLLDLPKVFVLAFLELILSADNAVVLGVISNSLPEQQRAKALYVGVFSSFILRALALLGASIFLESFWIQIVGAIYLLYLSFRYFTRKQKKVSLKTVRTFWQAVFLIEFLDIVFAIDSVVAGIAFINGEISKIWIVYFGGMLGVIGMRYAADLFSRLIDELPLLEKSAYLIVGTVGVKLGLGAFHIEIPPYYFWPLLLSFFLLGFLKKKKSSI